MKKKTIVLGLGLSGKSAIALLQRENCPIAVFDDHPIQESIPKNVQWISDISAIEWSEVEQVVISPGVPLTHPIAKAAQDHRIAVIGEIELSFRYLSNPSVGVTGTNGKTTVVLLIEHVLTFCGYKARALGNVGKSLSAYALQPNPEEILVVELSSFQLETMTSRSLDQAILLGITPDHLDRYSSMHEYAVAKCSIEKRIKKNGKLFISPEVAREYGSLLTSYTIFTDFADATPVDSISKMRYIQLGVPERQNIAAAYPICRFFGVGDKEFWLAIESFRKPRHRIEYVGEWNGISFYNDSKATNIDAVMYAMKNFSAPVILLAGGVHKGSSYRPWIDAFEKKVTRIVAFGEASSIMEQELKPYFAFDRACHLEEALQCAVKNAEPNTTIILSPGCSSYDQFRNYEHRGNEFKRMVEEKVWIERKRS